MSVLCGLQISPSKLIHMSSLLLALDTTKVNYFSLDIEGAEIQVLRSVPWHLVDIEVRRRPTFQFQLIQARK